MCICCRTLNKGKVGKDLLSKPGNLIQPMNPCNAADRK